MNLVQMTLSGGAFILFIVMVRVMALHRLPKGAFLALWEMAALRLLLPFTIPLPFGAFAPARHLPVVGEYLAAGGPPILGVPVTGLHSAVPASAQAGTALSAVLPAIWLSGTALMAAYFAVSYVRARGRFRISSPDNAPAVQRWLAVQRLRRPLKVRRSVLVSSPLTYGVLRPVILLPENMERDDETALTYVLTHEFIHIRRFDSVTKLVFAATLCIHWFNPLVWVMYVLANRDLELSCDERVMDTLGGREKAAYALTLINMEESRCRCFSPYNHFSKLAIEERIEAIMKYKKASVLALALAVALVVGATTAFAASAQPDTAPDGGAGFLGAGTLMDDSTLSSYTDPKDGKNYYSWDGGKTWEPLTDEELRQRSSLADVEWWTYEEYAAWLESEKAGLQAMLGEKGWTGGRGEFVWTQEIIDETIAMYERILQEIKEGKLYSKSVGGDSDSLLISGGAGSVFAKEEDGKFVEIAPDQVQVATFIFDGSTPLEGSTCTLDKTDGVPLDDWDVARAPKYTEEEWRQIIADIESGKIPPLEIRNDPNVTVRVVDDPGGDCAAAD